MQEIKEGSIINKKVNIDFNKKKEEAKKKSKAKEQEELKKLHKKLEEKRKKQKGVITTSKIINWNINEKGNNIDLNILNDIMVITDNVKIKYDVNAASTMVMTHQEAHKLQKKITNKTNEKKQEETIIKKTDTIITRIKEEMVLIINEIENMVFNISHEYNKEKVNQYEKRLINLGNKIERLKRQYNTLLNNVDFLNFTEFNDEQLSNTITYYKYIVNTNEQIYELANDCKKGLGKINALCDKQENLDKVMNSKKKELRVRDEEYYEHQNKLNVLEPINEEIKKNIEKQDEFIKSLMAKIEETEARFKDEVNFQGLELMTSNLLKVSLLIYAFKYRKWGLLLGTFLLSNNIIGIHNILKSQTKKTLLEYKELNKQLYEQMGDLNYITNLLSDSLNKLEKLKSDFVNKFSEYQDYFPEYSNIYNKINIVIEQLKAKEQELKKMEIGIETQHEKSKVKIKKIEGV